MLLRIARSGILRQAQISKILQPNVRFMHNIRNIGVVAHIDAGKTTTTEQILFLCGATSSVGRVDSGDTVMDFMPQERERGITIQAAAISMKWKNHYINLIDTPGHVDFTVEVERSARVLDGAVVVIDAVSGVQAQTRTVWKQVKKQAFPAIAFVNKMDRAGANFDKSIASLKAKLGANAVPIQYPVGSEETFRGVIDLISMSKILWADKNTRQPETPTREILTEDDPLYAIASNKRAELLESIAELDEVFMDKLFAEGGAASITQKEILDSLRRLSLQGAIVPTVLGASLRGKGVEPLLDCVLAFLPSPADRAELSMVHNKTKEVRHISPSKTDALCAFAFKVVHDRRRGPMVYARVYTGTLQAKQTLHNSNNNSRERANQLLKVSADDLDGVEECGPGGICCIVGLKNTVTGDTLVADKGPLQSYTLDGLTIPPPVFALAIEPERSAQQTDLENALEIMTLEDPSLKVEVNKESGLTMLRGIGELHLEIVCDRLKREHNLEVTTGSAYIAYRESLVADFQPTEDVFTYDRVLGLKQMFAQLTIGVSATSVSSEPTFTISEEVKEALTNDEFIALHDGAKSALTRGPRGYPIVGVHLTIKGVNKTSDTTPGAIRACVATFVDKLLRDDNYRQLLEPMMAMEVELPPQYVGDVLSDLTQRRAEVKEVNSLEEQRHVLSAIVPLATILGYASTLRSATQGEGTFSMEYSSHAPVLDCDIFSAQGGSNKKR